MSHDMNPFKLGVGDDRQAMTLTLFNLGGALVGGFGGYQLAAWLPLPGVVGTLTTLILCLSGAGIGFWLTLAPNGVRNGKALMLKWEYQGRRKWGSVVVQPHAQAIGMRRVTPPTLYHGGQQVAAPYERRFVAGEVQHGS